MNDESSRLQNKFNITVATASSNLANSVFSNLDQAEYYNVIDDNRQSVKSMNTARQLILGPDMRFATQYLAMKYNTYAEKIKGSKIISDSEVKSIMRQAEHPERDLTWKDGLNETKKGCYEAGSNCLTAAAYVGVFAVVVFLVWAEAESEKKQTN